MNAPSGRSAALRVEPSFTVSPLSRGCRYRERPPLSHRRCVFCTDVCCGGAVVSAAFTPGPWSPFMMNSQTMCITQHRQGFHKAGVVELAQGDITAEVRGKDAAEAKANAHLIAAAPELYEALEGAIHCIETFGVKGGGIDTWKALLAKARGEA